MRKEEREKLEQKLTAYRKCSKHEIVVFFVPKLGGESIEDAAHTTFNTWKIGRKKEDDGVLLIAAPDDRAVRIETGKGVGDVLPDVVAADILRDHVTPNLKEQRWFRAADDGTTAIGRRLGGCAIESIGAVFVDTAVAPPQTTPSSSSTTSNDVPTTSNDVPVAVPQKEPDEATPRARTLIGTLGFVASAVLALILAVLGALRERRWWEALPFFIFALVFPAIGSWITDAYWNEAGVVAFALALLCVLLTWRWIRKPPEPPNPWEKEAQEYYRNHPRESTLQSSSLTTFEPHRSESSSSSSSSSSSGERYSGGGGSSGGGGASDGW